MNEPTTTTATASASGRGWIVIYPAYIDGKKTRGQGRRMGRDEAVDVPLVSEIRDVLISKGFTAEVESKQYPRERARDHTHSGRVRLRLFDEGGDPINPEYSTRKDVLHLICQLIPKLKTRHSTSGSADGHDIGRGGTSTGGGDKRKRNRRK